MKFAPIIFLFASLIVGQIFVACTSDGDRSGDAASVNSNRVANSPAAGDNSNSAQDNIEELELTIKIPAHPEEVLWREEKAEVSGSGNAAANGKKLTAVIRFTAEDAAKIVAQAETYQPPAQTQIETESWFPAELIAQSELSGDETLKGTAYGADDFFQPPYDKGKLTRLENSNYFVLELSVK